MSIDVFHMSDTENAKWHTHKSKTLSINKLKQKLLRRLVRS